MTMSRLIDADELRNGLFHGYVEGKTDLTEREMGYQAGWNDALMYGVADAPTVDAVEVVRCKDCRYYHVYWDNNGHTEKGYGACDWINDNSVREDHFCAWGEKMDEVEHE